MEKIDYDFAKEVCRDRFISKQLMFLGVAMDQEVLDFLNSEKLRDQFEFLLRLAKEQKGKDFIARVRPDDDRVNYEIVSFDGTLIDSYQSLRGIAPAGEYEFFVFTLDELPIRYENPVADLVDRNKPGEKLIRKQSILFFAPPKKSLLVRGY